MKARTETTVAIRELDADTAAALGHDPGNRPEGRPLVEVVTETWFFTETGEFTRVDRHRTTGFLHEAAINPQHLQEV